MFENKHFSFFFFIFIPSQAKKELSAAKVYKLKQVCSSFVADIAQLLPSIDDEQTLEQLQQQLSNVYDITRMAAPQHIE